MAIAAGGAPLILSTRLATFKKRLMHRDFVNQVEASATGLISASPVILLIPVLHSSSSLREFSKKKTRRVCVIIETRGEARQ